MASGRDHEDSLHLFPTAERKVTTKIERDSTGLSGPEKTALIRGWGVIKKDIYIHSKNMFVAFLDKYPKYLEYFDFSDDPATKLQDNHSLHAHSLNVMNSFSTLIEFGLNDPVLFECAMKKMIRNHATRNVYRDDVRNLTDTVKIYILDVLKNQSSQTLEDGMEAFCNRIILSFDIKPAEKTAPKI